MANTSSHSLHSQAKNLADKVAFYIQAQALSSDFVRSDITRRDRMLQEFAQSPNVMTLGNAPPNKIHDPIAMMETYDSLLAQEPVTFEDHFYRMHYAFSAYILYQVNVVDKEIVEKPELFPIYTKYSQSSFKEFTQKHYLHNSSGPQSEPIEQMSTLTLSDRANCKPITGEQAALEILRDHVHLMQLQFAMSADASSEGGWRVDGVNLKPDGKTEYMVRFTDCAELFPLQQVEVVNLLCDSVIM